MKKALIVGGSSGIGLGIVVELLQQTTRDIYILDIKTPDVSVLSDSILGQYYNRVTYFYFDACKEDYRIFDDINDIDTLFISCGFGRVSAFEDLYSNEITKLIKCNELSVIQILHHYIKSIKSEKDFYCGVMVSISSRLVSPLFSVYSAAKSGLGRCIENINAELAAEKYGNRILDCSPGYIEGTCFYGKETDLEAVKELSQAILGKMQDKEVLYIPSYETVYKKVLQDFSEEPLEFALKSYEYKSHRLEKSGGQKPRTGFLSGTFDLFHIGHLNLLKRAKEQCDYLIVSVHENGLWKGKDAFISYEERKSIVQSIRYVDEVVEDFAEDSDAWDKFHYDVLFVGSDYLGSERFKKYEEYFKGKNVDIVYFPYTKGISSTKLRKMLDANMGVF